MATKKKSPAKKKSAAKSPAKKPLKAPAKPVAHKPAPKAATKPVPVKGKTAMTAADLKRLLLERKATPAKAIAFSLDEVREIAKKHEKQLESASKTGRNSKTGAIIKNHDLSARLEKPHKPHYVKSASLADILGFNPKRGKMPEVMVNEADVPDKFRRYYRLLLDLRHHVLTQLGEHTEETLLKSAKDDSGDLSGYGQHMADAGTDTFDRDFALSLVSSEQEALSEIEAAIKRVHAGTYGICESTQKPIAKERLLAVPFTRYSAEAKKQVERHSHRSIERGGLFGDGTEEEGGKMSADDGGDE
ncbi:MAG TPA: TraR/DksA C4-type zinc finger protein [Lacunisphaera sp.]|nr:TraR/DksA C4-type zinc finger protein [Lacunisphaera sp.]